MFTKPRKSKSRYAQTGKISQHKGNLAEKKVLASYKNDPYIFVFKRYEPYKRVGQPRKGVFKAVNQGKAGCDFAFFLFDGIAGMFELKSRKGTRITKTAVDAVQADELDKMVSLGHLSFVLVEMRVSDEDSLWFRVDWNLWYSGSKKSHNIEDLQRIGMLCPVDSFGSPLFFNGNL